MPSKSEASSLVPAMGREDRTLVTVLCRESIGLLAWGIDAVASLALEVSEELSSSSSWPAVGWPIRCRPAIGVGRPECCRWDCVGVVAGAFLRA